MFIGIIHLFSFLDNYFHMIKNFCIVSILLTTLISLPSSAVEVNDLYQAKVAVNSQTKKQRNFAQKKAMQAVLVKVGGQKSVLDNEVIKKALNNYNAYLTQYSYQRLQSFSQKSKNTEQLTLMVSFNEDKINQLFQQANLPIWGSLRPQVLLWFIEENRLSRQIISESSASHYPLLINQYANERGLPVIMPLMDLTDANQINIADVWGRFIDPVSAASSRYAAEAMVIVRLSNSSLISIAEDGTDCRPLCEQSQYAIDWTLVTDTQSGKQLSYQQYQGVNTEKLLQQAISDLTQVIYQDYALSTTSSHEFLIDVANVDSISEYMALITFLEDLSSVQSATLVSAKGSNRRFNLALLGSKNALLSSLKLNKQLQQHIDPLAEVIVDAVPVFYWGKP
jgi:hypothetical protein